MEYLCFLFLWMSVFDWSAFWVVRPRLFNEVTEMNYTHTVLHRRPHSKSPRPFINK